ncbi:MAG: hypothetical protein KJO07_08370 [Deltaproteobacteria bacterium]|nr:hypothetical protein [Deltaproteobacteria bacterium]
MNQKEKPVSSSLQQHVVRSYKIFGLVALVGILVGLAAFLAVNLFYLFDNSWIRPVILDSAHQEVVQMDARIGDEKRKRDNTRHQLGELEAERGMLEARSLELKRFEKDFEDVSKAERTRTYAGLMARRELHQSRLEAAVLGARKKALSERITALQGTLKSQGELLAKLESTPYARAIDNKVFLAFVPYENLENVQKDDLVFGCKWGIIRCTEVGRIGERLPGEVNSRHPHSDKPVRGLMVELRVDKKWAAEHSALFVDGKPLWLF